MRRYFTAYFILFFASLFLFTGYEAKATQLMGSELYYERLNATQVKVILKIYRKCCEDANAACAPANPAELGSGSLTIEELCPGGNTSTLSLSEDSVVDVTPTCDKGCSQCGLEGDNTPPCPPEAIDPSNPNYDPDNVYDFGIEVYYFSTVVTIDPNKCANLRFSWSSCCRNSDITTGLAGKGLYTSASGDFSVINSTPRFDELPVNILCANKNYIYSQTALDSDYDAQGRLTDKIVFSLTEPRGGTNGGTPLTYNTPYNYQEPLAYVGMGNPPNTGEKRMASAPLPPNFPDIDFDRQGRIQGFILDSASGDFLFHPTQSGDRTVVAVKIEEFRNGKKISEINRDVQFIVDGNCTANNAPVIYGEDNTSDQSLQNFHVQACKNGPVSLNVLVFDEDYFRINSRLGEPDAKDSVIVSYETNAPGAMVRVRPSSQNKSIAVVTFNWTPGPQDRRELPYFFTIRASDDYCQPPAATRRSFLIYVNPKPEVDTLTSLLDCGEVFFSATQDTLGSSTSKSRILNYEWRLEEPEVGTTGYLRQGYDKPGDPQRSKDTLRHQYVRDGKKPWSLEITDANGCSNFYRDTVEVTGPIAPNATFDLTVNQDTVEVSVRETGLAEYEWDFGDNTTATGDSARNIYGTKGDYSIQLVATTADGCLDSSTQTVTIDVVGLEAWMENHHLKVYPNPVDGRAFVQMWLPNTQTVAVQLKDASGRSIASLHDGPLNAGDHQFLLEAGALAEGLYFIEVRIGDKQGSLRMQVQR